MLKDSSARYQKTKEGCKKALSIKLFLKKKKKNNNNILTNDTKIFLQNKRKRLVEYRKNIKFGKIKILHDKILFLNMLITLVRSHAQNVFYIE